MVLRGSWTLIYGFSDTQGREVTAPTCVRCTKDQLKSFKVLENMVHTHKGVKVIYLQLKLLLFFYFIFSMNIFF